ncbi:MAG: DUF1049 domain-containing protein [Armatimonadetes bacterium]|nr:DUF1049 domain-containing protein [Armatimonadota bacterium]
MVKVIIGAVLGLLLLVYGALFLAWNMTPQDIVALRWFGGVQYSQALPVGSLVFIGLVVGALLMAIACWSAWASQRSIAKRAVAQVQKAKEKLQAQLDAINELRAQVAQLEEELESSRAGNGTWGQVSAGDIAVPDVTPGVDAAAADDPDVI